MDQKIKKLWTDALRSDEYEQGRGCLNRNDRLCCLGVLYEVLIENDVTPIKKSEPDLRGRVEYNGEDASLDYNVAGLVGIDEAACERLIAMNDKFKSSFEEIADYIDLSL